MASGVASNGRGAEPVYSTDPREHQRIAHLVLGQARPTKKVTGGKRKGPRNAHVLTVPLPLDPSIERAMQQRERWSHKRHATPETLEYASSPLRAGAMARLYAAGSIDKDQLAAAEQIATAFAYIGRDVSVTTASFETRIDGGGNFQNIFFERLGSVWREMAYTRWRAQLGPLAPAILDIVVNDAGLTIAAKRYRLHNRRMRQALLDALDLWPRIVGGVRRDVDEAALLDSHAGMMG